MPRTATKSRPKEKRSFTLSAQAVALLHELRKERHAPSVSSVLEEILSGVRRNRKRQKLEQAVASYYSSISEQERRDQEAWGDFALEQFSVERP